ncbi:MAG: DUF3618 domain-containing protein [Stellaceae bacterium]
MTARNGSYDGSEKSPHDLESDIEATRDKIGALLQSIEARLSPRRLIDRASGLLQETIRDSALGPAGLVEQNRVPLILLGAGLGWMLVAGGRPEQAPSGPAPVPTEAYARTKTEGFARAARRDTRGRLGRLVNDYPLASGVAGGLLGAAVALLIPRGQAGALLDRASRSSQPIGARPTRAI